MTGMVQAGRLSSTTLPGAFADDLCVRPVAVVGVALSRPSLAAGVSTNRVLLPLLGVSRVAAVLALFGVGQRSALSHCDDLSKEVFVDNVLTHSALVFGIRKDFIVAVDRWS